MYLFEKRILISIILWILGIITCLCIDIHFINIKVYSTTWAFLLYFGLTLLISGIRLLYGYLFPREYEYESPGGPDYHSFS